MVERVLCMHEAPGSMPGSSSFFFFFKIVLEDPGIDPGASTLQSTRSTI